MNRKMCARTLARRAWIMALAMILDLVAGDPPNRYHPVAWMGRAIASTQKRAPCVGNTQRFAYGLMLATSGASLVATLGWLFNKALMGLPAPLSWLGEALLLKSTFSWRGLYRAAMEVRWALDRDLDEARRKLSWHLVSRDTSHLTPSQVAAATIESVAENTSDGIVAPLFYYALGGLPLALVYRFLNTCDSMLGYHDAEHEWLGKAPARLDDVTNLLPSRLTAGLLILAAALRGENARQAWAIWRRDARKTASPNAGHPMSTMAGALGVELEKVGHYRLGAGQRLPEIHDIDRSLHLMSTAAILTGATLIGLSLIAGRNTKEKECSVRGRSDGKTTSGCSPAPSLGSADY